MKFNILVLIRQLLILGRAETQKKSPFKHKNEQVINENLPLEYFT